MNSRERVVTAINHQEPDRVPIDFGGLHTSVHQDGHKKLLEYLGMEVYDAPIIDMFQQIVDPAPELKERFHNDVIGLSANPSRPWKLTDPEADVWVDEWDVYYRRPPGGYWYDLYDQPLKDGTIEELEKYKWPDPTDPKRVEGLAEKARDLYENTDKALIIYSPTAGVWEHSYWLRGIENLYMDMATNLQYVEALAERIVEWQLAFWEDVLDVVGQYVQVVQLGEDLGGQHGPIFSPEIYRNIYKPRHRRLTDLIHRKTDAKIYFHSCGSLYQILPDIIDSGMEILNPVQVSAKDMDSARLKKEFGQDLCFWGGGADATTAMTFATPEELKEEVKHRIHDLGPGGGFVFGPIHNIQPNVPPENIAAFYEAAYEYGQYPIVV